MSPVKVMVIDDNEGDQFLCQHTIKEYESTIEVIEACDGRKALELLEHMDQPDYIFLDINMPIMDGFEFLEQYQQKYSSNGAKVILLTSSVVEKDMMKGRSFSVIKDYIEKPLSTENVVNIIAVT